MPRIGVIAFAQLPAIRCEPLRNDAEMVAPVIREAIERSKLGRTEIDLTVSGSTDFLSGIPFSFVHALDAVAPWPPIVESHVEMDGAWAFYEAWVRLQHGDFKTALVFSFGKSSTPDSLSDVLTMQLDPYCVAPLWPDALSIAALQARLVLEHTDLTERHFAEVVARSRRQAQGNPYAQIKGAVEVDALLAEPYIASPLRRHDCPPISDGAAAMVIAVEDVANQVCDRPAWIIGFDHRIDAQDLGGRDLTTAASATLAAEKAGLDNDKIDVAELYAPFSHQELILSRALGLTDGVSINPSGGALTAHPIMSAGLIRAGEVANRIIAGQADRGVAHATSGPCLQQNMVTILEGN